MKKILAYSLIFVGSLYGLSTANEDKSNLLLMIPPLIAANGNQEEVKDCYGVSGGTAVVDSCGVCGGDGSSCTTDVPTITSAGQVWMDRNLGASRVAISSTDPEAYGGLYQWGRDSDGHEKRESSITGIQATSDTPGHGNFIAYNFDWRIPSNDNLWQGVSGINNPCPAGFRLPTDTEWEIELTTWSSKNAAGAFASPLKLVVAGYRTRAGALINLESGYYGSSVPKGVAGGVLYFKSDHAELSAAPRAGGRSVRCIKD